jgi:UDP-glucose 4-epimerase
MALELLDCGEQPIVIDNFSTTPQRELPEEIPLIVGDISDSSLVRQVIQDHGIREIIHFAAKIVVPESIEHPLDYYRSNTIKAHALFEIAVELGVERILFSSTAAVYGNPPVVPVPENAATTPLSPYGTSKLMSEWILRDVARAHGMDYAILRYFNVAGADPSGRAGQRTPDATHLIKVAVQAALGLREGITVFGTDYDTPDGTCVRDYIHVTDLIAAHGAALRHLRVHGGSLVLNCGYGRGYSVLEVLDAVRRVSGVDFPVAYGPRRAGDPAAIIADATRIKAALDWKPRHDDLHTIAASALAWEERLTRSAPL